jgi:hypothetical protein
MATAMATATAILPVHLLVILEYQPSYFISEPAS